VSRIDREHLIERYLRGELSPAQEERFFIEIATNDELRHELKAYRVVEETLVRDSRRVVAPQTALRARLEQQMAGMRASATSAAASSAPVATGGVAGATMVPMKWFLVAVIGASLAVGGLVMSSLSDRSPFTRTSSTQGHDSAAPGMMAKPRHDTVTVGTPESIPALRADDATPTGTTPEESASPIEQAPSSFTHQKGSSAMKHTDTTGQHIALEKQRRNDMPTSLQQSRNSASGRSTTNGDSSLEESATVPLTIVPPKPIGDKP
jgi:hypothetical protein